jgi:hypothetical protein
MPAWEGEILPNTKAVIKQVATKKHVIFYWCLSKFLFSSISTENLDTYDKLKVSPS